MDTFLLNAQQIFDVAQSDTSGEDSEFALLIRPDGGIHLIMESEITLDAAATSAGARTAYRVSRSRNGIRASGIHVRTSSRSASLSDRTAAFAFTLDLTRVLRGPGKRYAPDHEPDLQQPDRRIEWNQRVRARPDQIEEHEVDGKTRHRSEKCQERLTFIAPAKPPQHASHTADGKQKRHTAPGTTEVLRLVGVRTVECGSEKVRNIPYRSPVQTRTCHQPDHHVNSAEHSRFEPSQ